MNYWKECLTCALDDENITLSDAQISSISEKLEDAHEGYAVYAGIEAATNGEKSDAELELEELKREIEKRTRWVNNTKPCDVCITTGIVKDSWGKDQTCGACEGAGRV
ncbi:hypothetical protein [Agarilytica rhodophyticola]|uniref:hypothetical protein n=1 Tax=Agarilytica rhodophyticola TaxID=1737490 RepID=UPI000B344B1C|nr:hypothetical protein [Agarilytica rhodophyticola]